MQLLMVSIRNSLLLVTAIAILHGCQANEVETGEVSGVVTLDGQPVEKAVVYFYPDGGGRSSMAETQPDGRYELIYKGTQKGAKIGTHTVTLTTATESSRDESGKVIKGNPEKFPKEYTVDGTVKREVKAGKNEFNFDVTSK